MLVCSPKSFLLLNPSAQHQKPSYPHLLLLSLGNLMFMKWSSFTHTCIFLFKKVSLTSWFIVWFYSLLPWWIGYLYLITTKNSCLKIKIYESNFSAYSILLLVWTLYFKYYLQDPLFMLHTLHKNPHSCGHSSNIIFSFQQNPQSSS